MTDHISAKLFSGKKRKLQSQIMKLIATNHLKVSPIYEKTSKGLMKLSEQELESLWSMVVCSTTKPVEKKVEKSEKEQMQEAVQGLMHCVNSMSFFPPDFVEEINRTHPTLQQSMFRLIIAAIKNWANNGDKGWYDLRSEATCKICQKIVKRMGDEMSGVPMV